MARVRTPREPGQFGVCVPAWDQPGLPGPEDSVQLVAWPWGLPWAQPNEDDHRLLPTHPEDFRGHLLIFSFLKLELPHQHPMDSSAVRESLEAGWWAPHPPQVTQVVRPEGSGGWGMGGWGPERCVPGGPGLLWGVGQSRASTVPPPPPAPHGVGCVASG